MNCVKVTHSILMQFSIFFHFFLCFHLLNRPNWSLSIYWRFQSILIGFYFLINLKLKYLILFWYWGLNSGPKPWATPPALFWEGFFRVRSSRICRGWLRNFILLLISASWVAGITGVSLQHLTVCFLLMILLFWSVLESYFIFGLS
jgi:hypothetical protein